MDDEELVAIIEQPDGSIRACFDEEDISFDIYQRARDLMEVKNVAWAASTKERFGIFGH